MMMADLSEHSAGGRPTKAQAAIIHERILDGARAAFCKKGFANTSIDEIAEKLGISKHTIYRRHKSKGSLLEAVVERDIGKFTQYLFSAVDRNADPLDSVRMTAWSYFEMGSSREYAAFYLSVSAEAAVSAHFRDRLAAWSKKALEPLEQTIRAAQAAGRVNDGDPTIICEILVDLLEGATNRVRLNANESNRNHRDIFSERWTVFVSAMCRRDT